MSELSSYEPSAAIIEARLAVLVSEPTAKIQAMWDGLQSALEAYDVATIASLSGEGQSRSMNFDAARVQVAEWLAAYKAAVEAEATDLPADADPVLSRQPMGHTFSHAYVDLRC